jgi:hypothetical protein
MIEVLPAPRKPVNTVIGIVEGMTELEGITDSDKSRLLRPIG